MPTSAPGPRVLRFADFELDVRAGELRKRGIKLRLQGQPLQVLAALLTRSGDVVTREELRAQIWTADTSSTSTIVCTMPLRAFARCSATPPRRPDTLKHFPRRGYRFIGQVRRSRGSVRYLLLSRNMRSPPKCLSAQPMPNLANSWPQRILTALVIGAAVWLAHVSARPTSAASRLNSIAVLPLANLSGDPSEEFFADGMTDQLITDLAEVGSLRVISRTSVMHYKGTKKGLPEIARELNVDAIVEGSVVRSGQRVRVTAQLIQAPTDQHLWAETYDRDLGDVLKATR